MSEVLLTQDNLVDLSRIDSQENFLFKLTNIIETNNLQGKTVRINFGQVNISGDDMRSMLSVLKGYKTEIEILYAESRETTLAAIEEGLTVSGQKIETQEPDQEPGEIENEEQKLENILSQDKDPTETQNTLYIKQTLRSGQRIEHDGNLVIVGDCNGGSEIIATGDILVWGILSGIAHAGSKGNSKACIRAFKINAIQLRIADYLARKPDRLEIDRSEKADYFNPEEAKISEGEIVIYSLHQAYD